MHGEDDSCQLITTREPEAVGRIHQNLDKTKLTGGVRGSESGPSGEEKNSSGLLDSA